MWQKSDAIVIFILTPLVISIALSMDIFVPSLLNIMESFSVDEGTVQWTLSIFMFGVGITQLFCGPITDHFGRKNVAFAGLIVYLFGTAVCILSNSIYVLIIGRLLQSLGSCATLVVAYAIVKDLYSLQKSAKIYSYLGSMTMLAPLLAPMLGGYLNIWFDTWRASFIFLFLFALFSIVTTFLFIPETLTTERHVKITLNSIVSSYLSVFKNRTFLLNAFFALTGMVILFGFCGVSSFLLINTLHVSKQVYGLCFGSNSIVFIITTLICVRNLDKIGIQNSLFVGLVLLVLGSATMLIVNSYADLSILTFMLPMLIITAGLGFIMGPAAACALAEFSAIAGTASALFSSIQFLGAAIIGSALLSRITNTAIPFAKLIFIMSIISLFLFSFSKLKIYKKEIDVSDNA